MTLIEQRRLDDLGRLVLPAGMRKALDWSESQPVSIRLDPEQNAMILTQKEPSCLCCGKVESLKTLPNGRMICPDCLAAAH